MRNMISIILPLDATKEELAAAVSTIEQLFGDSISPSDIKHHITVQPPSQGSIPLPPPSNDTTSVVTATGELDIKGMPWDARIHAATKTKTAEGSWRYRRNCDAALIASVEAAIKGTVAAGTTVAAAGSAPPPPPPAAGSAPPPPPPAPSNVAFTNFVLFITTHLWSATNPSGKINPEWLKTTLEGTYGVANGDLQNMAHMPEAAIIAAHNGIKTAYGL